MNIIPQIIDNSPAILIKNKRIRLQMTQKELADAVGMSNSEIGQFADGKMEKVSHRPLS